MSLRQPRAQTGYHCMRLGWTEWVYDKAGKVVGERLTPAGRAVLASFRGEG